jgi:protein gp37
MSDRSKIEWTDATWNPVTGCTKVSPGCDHCYAETLAERFRGTPGHYYEHGFDLQLRPDKLDQPLRWKRPRRVFVNSMSDLFHADIPDEYIAKVFAVMALAPQHTFQVLTKRPGRMRSLMSIPWFHLAVEQEATYIHEVRKDGQPRFVWVNSLAWPLPNVWLGVSAEDQKWANIRIPVLSVTPAAVRFVSMEPLLGPIDCSSWLYNRRRLSWVICGGESGRGARPMHPDWVRTIRDQCQSAEVAFHFKQWGEWAPADHRSSRAAWVLAETGATSPATVSSNGAEPVRWGPYGDRLMDRVGKRTAGRELDGRTWDEYPSL